MYTRFKITIAIAISLVIIFRLFFVNIYLITSLKTAQNNSSGSHVSSSVKKKRRNDVNTVEVAQSDIAIYTAIEDCKENSDNEEDLVKTNTPALLSYFDASFRKLADAPGSDNPFDFIKCNLYPKKYLAFSILRV